jgi:hypothetical protein
MYDHRYGRRVPAYISYGYHYQLALYALGSNTIKSGAQILSFVKETDPQQTEQIILSSEMLEETLDEIRTLVPKMEELKNANARCGQCNYCKTTFPHTTANAEMQYITTDL